MPVTTLEEEEYPNSYHRRVAAEGASDDAAAPQSELPSIVTDVSATSAPTAAVVVSPDTPTPLKETHLVFQENQRGANFDKLFGPYLMGASRITVTDPYLRTFHQQRNLMDLLETISKQSGPENEVAVHVITAEDEFNVDRQTENFQKMADACLGIGIQFTWEYDTTGTKHDRDITTDHGWKIVLSRGLDVFQRFELNDAFSFANRMQQHRQCKEFNVTYVKVKST
ncbi:MAG TPA: MIT C-terminal domain-containing protein [Ferrovaceae bacterium]|nr:MIT C-terminal domain-containing protein [Ferrovaceae bacterium]HQU07331.1 MIT C-terminal domain-containing protein [Ferrovaceae bacterium]